MKVLQVNVTSNWGSTGRIVEEIGKEAIVNHYTSYIAYGRYASSSISHTIQIGYKAEVYQHFLQTRLFDRHGLGSTRATRHLIKQIISINPDIIHLHNIHGYYLNYPIFFYFLSKVDIPIIWTLHDCWAFTGHCTYYSYEGCKRWKTLCHDCPLKNEYPRSLFLDRSEQNFRDKMYAFTLKKEMTLITVSDWLAREVKQSFLKKYPIKTIHNGIDVEVFKPLRVRKTELGIAENKFVVLGVANVWSPRKGLQDFISLRKFLSDDYVIILIGLNKKQLELLPKGIIGLQRTKNVNELAKYYSISDVYLNASVEETLGLTTVESLSCGTPAIVYNSTACPEAVSQETGVVVAPCDVKRIVSVLQEMKEGRLHFDLNKCRERAVLLFNSKIQYSKYIQLYNEILLK